MGARLNASITKLIRQLADGHYHSGENLGAALGISRAAVWKQLQRLSELRLEVEAVRGTGYRLTRRLDLYDAERIGAAYRAQAAAVDAAIEVVDSTDSTNSDLLQRAARAGAAPVFLFAEHQRAGRGRRGRDWVTPYAAGIAFSMLRRFDRAPAELGALSLVAGVSLVETLARQRVQGLRLKWPNDLVHVDAQGELRKLGGVLVEAVSEAEGPVDVVIGVGINQAMPASEPAIEQPYTDLQTLLGTERLDRSRLAGELAAALACACEDFEARGPAAYLERWAQLDALNGRQVEVQRGAETFTAVARGIDERGALLVQANGALRTVLSGEVSVRTRHDPGA